MIPLLMLLAAAPECHPVNQNHILGRDLASATAIFANLPPDLVIGNAPQPGARRFFEPAELIRVARANHVEPAEFTSLCFERPTAVLDSALVTAAMRKALGAAPATIEIVALSKYPAPQGELVFPRDSLLEPATGDTAVWNGYVAYDGGRFAVWARVRVTTLQSRLVCASGMPSGHIVQASDVHLEEASEFPRRTVPLASVEAAVGQVTRRAIPAAAILIASMLETPNDVDRGQNVMVEVHSGGVVLKLEAKAESAGHRGETIALRNSTSGTLFRAEILGKGHVLVNCQSLSEVPQ